MAKDATRCPPTDLYDASRRLPPTTNHHEGQSFLYGGTRSRTQHEDNVRRHQRTVGPIYTSSVAWLTQWLSPRWDISPVLHWQDFKYTSCHRFARRAEHCRSTAVWCRSTPTCATLWIYAGDDSSHQTDRSPVVCEILRPWPVADELAERKHRPTRTDPNWYLQHVARNRCRTGRHEARVSDTYT